MTKRILLAVGVLITLIFSFSSASASVFCDRTIVTVTNSSTTDTFTCSNNGIDAVAVSTSGYFSINPTSLSPNSSTSFTVNIANNAPSGYSPGLISFGTLYFIPVNVTTPYSTSPPPVTTSGCQINPSLVSYTQSIQQGTQMPLPKITFNPVDCPNQLILTPSSVSIQGGIVTPQGQKPIALTSVVSDGVILSIDTAGLSSQTYTSELMVTAFSKTFNIPFTIIVTTGTTPASNFTISTLPTCSLTSTTLNINSTYSLVCNQLQPDVTIVPKIDTDYIEGTGTDKSSSQYVWYFRPKKYGNTVIKAEYFYQNSPVGTPYSQEVKISSSGLSIAGTELDVLFTPSLSTAVAGQEVIIQIIDNKSNSLVDEATVYIDAKPLNFTNGFYKYIFEENKNYSLRAKASGYDDLVKTIGLTSKEMFIYISPEKGDSNTAFSINTSAENATLAIDGNAVSNPYLSTLTAGKHEVVAIKEGYFTANKSLEVELALTASLSGEFKKGIPQVMTLTKNATWTMFFQSDAGDNKKSVISGTGNQVSFTPDKAGLYTLQSGDYIVGTWTIAKWNGKWFGISWYFIILGVGIIIFIIYAMNRSGSSGSDGLVFGGNVRAPG